MNLNITSLMDILTIILIFLIVSFSTEESEITPPKDFPLPPSTSQQSVKLAVKISVGPEEVRVEDSVIFRLAGGKIKASDLDGDKHIKPLLKEMKRQKAKLAAGTVKSRSGSTDEEEDEPEDEIVYFEAAKGTRYEIIDRVLKTAATAGFVKFRLAVRKLM
jgi:biopolymer transport protein ExbD